MWRIELHLRNDSMLIGYFFWLCLLFYFTQRGHEPLSSSSCKFIFPWFTFCSKKQIISDYSEKSLYYIIALFSDTAVPGLWTICMAYFLEFISWAWSHSLQVSLLTVIILFFILLSVTLRLNGRFNAVLAIVRHRFKFKIWYWED